MKIITINLPEAYLKAIQTLNDFLSNELHFYGDLNSNTFKSLIKNQRDHN